MCGKNEAGELKKGVGKVRKEVNTMAKGSWDSSRTIHFFVRRKDREAHGIFERVNFGCSVFSI